MGGYVRWKISVTVEEFQTAFPKGFGSIFISNSKEMIAVHTALTEYWKNPTEFTRLDLKGKVHDWKSKKASEFASRDKLSKGVCSRLLLEAGPLDEKQATDGIILHGVDRPAAKDKPLPRIIASDESVKSLMVDLLCRREKLGVILIDLYGANLKAAGLDKTYGDEHTVAEHIIEILRFLTAARMTFRQIIPVLNFIMAANQTFPEIARELPLYAVTIKKPSNNIFENTNVDEVMAKTACRYWVVTGFDANFCVAASIFGNPTLKAPLPGKQAPQKGWTRGLLDRGYHVITSRRILGSSGDALQPQDGWPWLGPANR